MANFELSVGCNVIGALTPSRVPSQLLMPRCQAYSQSMRQPHHLISTCSMQEVEAATNRQADRRKRACRWMLDSTCGLQRALKRGVCHAGMQLSQVSWDARP